MINKIDSLTSMRKDSKNPHGWVIYSNPRNGKVRITACLYCGSMLREGSNDSVCTGEKEKHPISSKGWKTDGQPAFIYKHQKT